MNDKKGGFININRTDGTIVIAIAAIWGFLLWLASNVLALTA